MKNAGLSVQSEDIEVMKNGKPVKQKLRSAPGNHLTYKPKIQS